MSMHPSNHRSVSSSINITPLIDVVLVILIIFMVGTPLATLKHDVHLDDAKAKPEPTPTPIPRDDPTPVYRMVVKIGADGVIRVDDVHTALAGLGATIASKLARGSDSWVVFQASDEVDYGRVMCVIDVIRRSGGKIGIEV